MERVVELTEGYSSADLMAVIREVAMMPIREIPTERLIEIKDMNDVRAVNFEDFRIAMRAISPSVSHNTIKEFELWRKEKG